MGQMLHVPTLPHSLFDDSPLSGAAFDFKDISQSQEALADPFSGTLLDGYQLGEPIGSGGCARVYRGKHAVSGAAPASRRCQHCCLTAAVAAEPLLAPQ